MQLCISHTATPSHEQGLAFSILDTIEQSTAALFSKRVQRLLESCATRYVTLAILSRDKVAR